ncbi:hypothetical protein D3273_24025 [Lichenibacterium minor]|uniref:Uncharacterized protein n=2 Tax=Lichenibacterium minor TaxID=2316528 RepID=A0A4Q2U162_9HYPH|nr:hypothetical protein D3273_24025 [Lichenibacterium minor]
MPRGRSTLRGRRISGCNAKGEATRTDIARQYRFAKRDQLFDLAREGRIDFRSKECRAMRGDLDELALDVEGFTMPIVWLRSPLVWLLTPVAIVAVMAALPFGAVRRALIDLLGAMGERAQIQAEGAWPAEVSRMR